MVSGLVVPSSLVGIHDGVPQRHTTVTLWRKPFFRLPATGPAFSLEAVALLAISQITPAGIFPVSQRKMCGSRVRTAEAARAILSAGLALRRLAVRRETT